MLHEFVTENRQLLIARCREKVAKRFEPTEAASSIENGVPLFLEQLSQTLAHEQTTSARGGDPEPAPAPTEIGRSAALHGAELLRRGFTVDQVVHDYGDVCQCVTALAWNGPPLSPLMSFGRSTAVSTTRSRTPSPPSGQPLKYGPRPERKPMQQRLVDYIADHRRLSAIARQSFMAIKTGSIGQGEPRRSANAHLERTRRAHRPAPASPLK